MRDCLHVLVVTFRVQKAVDPDSTAPANALLSHNRVSFYWQKAFYASKTIRCPAASVEGVSEEDEIGGTALRLLHQLAASLAAAEAISRAVPSAAEPFMSAMERWGLAGSVLALEAIKRSIVLDNPTRDLLVEPLLRAGLLQKLLEKLDWQQGGNKEEVCLIYPVEFHSF